MNIQYSIRARSSPLLVAAVFAAGLAPASAPALTITSLTLQNTAQMVTTSDTTAYTTALFLPTAGTLSVTVSDQLFPSALTQLEVTLFSGTGSGATLIGGPLSGLNTNGGTSAQTFTWTYDLSAGTYTSVFAAAAAPANAAFPGMPVFALGLYNDTITFTPTAAAVPLSPIGGVPLAAAVGGIGLYARRRSGRARASLVGGSDADV